MHRSYVFAGLLLAIALFTACSNSGQEPFATPTPKSTTVPSPTPTPESLTIEINALNSSGQSGTARLVNASSRTNITLSLNAGPAGVDMLQPAHIRKGTCE